MPDDRYFMTYSEDRPKVPGKDYRVYEPISSVILWDTLSAKQSWSAGPKLEHFFVSGRGLNSDQTLFAGEFVDTLWKSSVMIWQIGKPAPPVEIIPDMKFGNFWQSGFVENSRLFFIKRGKEIHLYDSSDGKKIGSIFGKRDHMSAFVVRENTLVVETCDWAEIFDLSELKKVTEFQLACTTGFDFVSDWSYSSLLSLSASGSELLASHDKSVRLFDPRTGTLLETFVAPEFEEKKRKNIKAEDGLTGDAGWLLNGKYMFAAAKDKRSILIWARRQ
jgi:WD40 repeat protein